MLQQLVVWTRGREQTEFLNHQVQVTATMRDFQCHASHRAAACAPGLMLRTPVKACRSRPHAPRGRIACLDVRAIGFDFRDAEPEVSGVQQQHAAVKAVRTSGGAILAVRPWHRWRCRQQVLFATQDVHARHAGGFPAGAGLYSQGLSGEAFLAALAVTGKYQVSHVKSAHGSAASRRWRCS